MSIFSVLNNNQPTKTSTQNTPVKSSIFSVLNNAGSSNVPQSNISVRTYQGVPGSYNYSGDTNQKITSPRDYANLASQKGTQRDHIIPVALGGTSDKSNLQYLSSDQAAYKDKVEKYLIGQVNSGKIQPKDARAKILDWKAQDIPGQVSYNSKDNNIMGNIKGFLSQLPSTLKQFFSGTIEGAKNIIQDPLNIAPSTTGEGNVQFAKDFYNKTIGSVVNTAVDEKNRIGDFFNSFKNNAPTSEKVATGLKTISGVANIAFSPITAVFQGAEQFPVLGTIAKAVTLPFTTLGDAGSHTAITALNTLPLPEKDKVNLRDAIGEISGLAFQVVGGKAIADVLTSGKILSLKEKFGSQGADVIVSAVKEKASSALEDTTRQQAGFVSPGAALEDAKQALEKFKQGQEGAKFGESLRTFFTGERDTRVAETNQLRDVLQKLVPDAKEQEALTIMRDFRNKPEELAAKLDEYRNSDNPTTKKLVPLLEKALNPTEQMSMADKAMTSYFTQKLQEGKDLGFLESKITPDEYVTHLLQPEDVAPKKSGVFSSKIGRNFQFAKGRTFDTVLQAVEAGVKPKTLNALDALTIYGDKHSTAAATKILTNELKTTDMGKWGFRSSDNVPKDWVELAPGKELFRNRIPFNDETGKPSIATQNLYVPQKVADALKPIIEPSGLSNLPGFRAGRLYQAYLKSVQLGLSVFHLKALNITALNNEGITGVIKSYANDLKSPEFLDTEKSFIRAGGTTSILGRTIEAYRAAKPSSLPTRMDLIKDLPIIKQGRWLGTQLTKVTFDVIQRKFKVTDFALKDASWITKHPEATEAEHFTAQKAIAKEVNSVYGGLQWENIGVQKAALDLAKFLVLAPDWTFSNFLTSKYAFEGGAAGKAARTFWVRSAITGTVLTQGMSLLMSGQLSKDPTSVYMGKDKNGKEIYSNMFFAGASSDAINLYKNIADYGIAVGFGQTLAAKGSPFVKASSELFTNRNYFGQQVVPTGAGPVVGSGIALKNLGKNLAPIPFTFSNIWQMLTDPKKQYSLKEYITSMLGTKPRHVVPTGQKEVTSGKKKGQLVPATPRTKLPIIEQIKTGNLYQPLRK